MRSVTTPSSESATREIGWEMALIHRIFRRSFAEIERRVGEVPPDALDRAHALADHLAFTLDGLHAHHSTEDESLWPLLLDRAPHARTLLQRMEEDHVAVAALVDSVRAVAGAWAQCPTAAASSELAALLAELLAQLVEHLDEEEREVVALISRYVTKDEWGDFGERAFEKFEPRQRPIAMGQMLEVASPNEAAAMFATLPPPVRIMWRLAGRRMYRRYVARFRGKSARFMSRAMRAATPVAVRHYERTDGRRGGTAKGLPVLLLTVAGRRSGTLRTTPTAYLEDRGNYIVAGSGGGMAQEPQWFRNLRRSDRVTIRVGARTHEALVRVPDRAERDAFWHGVVLPQAPFFAEYERRSSRLIPLAVLTPVTTSD